MNFWNDFFSQLYLTIAEFQIRQTPTFYGVVALAIVVAALCWAACSSYTKLWNTGFRANSTHHALCAVAATLTFCFVLLYPSLGYMKETSERRLTLWEETLKNDSAYNARLFREQYFAVKALNIEDFSRYPEPGNDGSKIPLTKDKSRTLCGQMDADGALQNFRDRHPFLRAILNAQTQVPGDLVKKDMDRFFAIPGNTSYPHVKGVQLASSLLQADLATQTPKVVAFSRMWLIALFVLVQAIVFGIVGLAAYKDLRHVV